MQHDVNQEFPEIQHIVESRASSFNMLNAVTEIPCRVPTDPQEGRLPRATEHGDPALVAQFLYATLKILLIFFILMTE